jgi:hypothetical protein
VKAALKNTSVPSSGKSGKTQGKKGGTSKVTSAKTESPYEPARPAQGTHDQLPGLKSESRGLYSVGLSSKRSKEKFLSFVSEIKVIRSNKLTTTPTTGPVITTPVATITTTPPTFPVVTTPVTSAVATTSRSVRNLKELQNSTWDKGDQVSVEYDENGNKIDQLVKILEDHVAGTTFNSGDYKS